MKLQALEIHAMGKECSCFNSCWYE